MGIRRPQKVGSTSLKGIHYRSLDMKESRDLLQDVCLDLLFMFTHLSAYKLSQRVEYEYDMAKTPPLAGMSWPYYIWVTSMAYPYIHVSRICDAGKGIHINLLTSHTGGSFCGRLVVCRWSRRSLYVCVNPSVTLIRIWSQPCTTVFTKPLCYDHGQTTVQYNLRCSYRS